MKHPRLTKFLYAHPVLAVLLPFLPALFVCAGLWYFEILNLLFSFLLATWLLFMLILPVRASFSSLLTHAHTKLERDCDPLAYLEELSFMRRRRLPFSRQFTLDLHYGVGLDAAGRAQESYAWLEKCLPALPRLAPPARFQLYLALGSAAAHEQNGSEKLPALIGELDKLLAEMHALPPFYLFPMRAARDTVEDARRFHAGELDGLRARYVDRVNAASLSPSARANKITACLWLARIYEREGALTEARAMYTYVAENGGTMGAAAEAKTPLSRLSQIPCDA